MTQKEEHDETADLLGQILDELRQLNQNLTGDRTRDRLNEEMDLVK